MPLLSLNDLSIRFRGPVLLDGIEAVVEYGQHIGLLGRNGAGKSTLLKLIDAAAHPKRAEVHPDHGSITFAPGSVVRQLRQDVPTSITGTIYDVVFNAAAVGVDESDYWRVEQDVERVLFDMKLSAERTFESLSTGLKRRVLLAQAIVAKPDLLLLDEPTNHLDLTSILWLEDYLVRFPGTLIFVTHDRSFLRRIATRIWEIELGKLFDWSCDYDTFRKRKADQMAAQAKENELFDKKLAEEEVWIRQGIKARRTRNEGRVRALEAMRVKRQERQERVGNAKLKIQEADRSGMLVAEAKEIKFSYDKRPVVSQFSTTIMRGDKVGIIGPNGAGKTTLLKLLLGQLQPSQGTVRLGTNLQIAYFDQLRNSLDPEKTVQDNVADGNDTVKIGNQSRHIIGYLQDFLFTPERARSQVKFLSGGERNRVLLAKLMTQPANVIVLDEPTNDLDTETMDLLEEQIVEFAGTVLVVSHDRSFLNNVVTSTIVFEDDEINEYVGGYDDWFRIASRRLAKGDTASKADTNKREDDRSSQEVTGASTNVPASIPAPVSVAVSAESKPVSTRKLSFKEKFELEQLPKRIEQLEKEIAQLHELMGQPDFFKKPGAEIAITQSKLQQLETELQTSYQRWELLDS